MAGWLAGAWDCAGDAGSTDGCLVVALITTCLI